MGIHVVNHFLVSEIFTNVQFDLTHFQNIWEILFCFLFTYLFSRQDFSGCPDTHFLDQADLELRDLLPSAFQMFGESLLLPTGMMLNQNTTGSHISVFLLGWIAFITCKLKKKNRKMLREYFSQQSICWIHVSKLLLNLGYKI